MKQSFNIYLIITQLLSMVLAPPLIAYVLCDRYKAKSWVYVLSITLSTIIGLTLFIIYLIRTIKQHEKKQAQTKK